MYKRFFSAPSNSKKFIVKLGTHRTPFYPWLEKILYTYTGFMNVRTLCHPHTMTHFQLLYIIWILLNWFIFLLLELFASYHCPTHKSSQDFQWSQMLFFFEPVYAGLGRAFKYLWIRQHRVHIKYVYNNIHKRRILGTYIC